MSRMLVWCAAALVVGSIAVAAWAGSRESAGRAYKASDLITILEPEPTLPGRAFQLGLAGFYEGSYEVVFFDVATGSDLWAAGRVFPTAHAAAKSGIDVATCFVTTFDGGPGPRCRSHGWVRANATFYVAATGFRKAELGAYAAQIDARAAAAG